MKYKRVILSLCLLGLFTLLGIWIYSKVELWKAFKSLKELESIHMEGTVSLFLDDYKIDLKGSANYKKKVLSASLTTDYVWNPIELDLYANMDGDNITFYLFQNLSEDCVKSSQEISRVEWKKVDFKKKDIKIKKLASDKKSEKKYKVTIFNNSKEISFDFYMKNGKITGINSSKKVYLSKEKNIYFSNFSITFSSWNRISSLSIPENRIESCKEIDKNMLKKFFF